MTEWEQGDPGYLAGGDIARPLIKDVGIVIYKLPCLHPCAHHIPNFGHVTLPSLFSSTKSG